MAGHGRISGAQGLPDTAESNSEPGWCTWTRWCSVCAQRFTHVYPADCEEIECKCGAWVPVPKMRVLRGGKDAPQP